MSEQVREAARDLAAAAEAWDKTLSAWCDGPERDALRDAVLNAQRLLALPPQPVQKDEVEACITDLRELLDILAAMKPYRLASVQHVAQRHLAALSLPREPRSEDAHA